MSFKLEYILITILLISKVEGIIPKSCVSNATSTAFTCCPTPAGYTNPCGFPKLGKCEPVTAYHQILRKKLLTTERNDFRMFWPERVFSHLCKCRERRWGSDCSECAYGYEGKDCDKRFIRKRRSISTYTASEKRLLVNILLKSRHVKSPYLVPYIHPDILRWTGEFNETDVYSFGNFIHWLGSMGVFTKNATKCSILDRTFDNGHLDTGFPVYHRYILLIFERLLSDVARTYFGLHDFSMPYWDWTDSQSCPVCSDDLFGAESTEWNELLKCNYISNTSAFGSSNTWPVYCQPTKSPWAGCAPCHLSTNNTHRLCRHWTNMKLPTVEEVMELMTLTKFMNHDIKCIGFEGMFEDGDGCTCPWKQGFTILHGHLHELVKGTLLPPAASIFDPLFLIHHSQSDRLFERWLRRLNPSSREFPNINRNVPMCRDCYVGVFFPLITFKELFADSRTMGYSYDNFSFGSLSENITIARWDKLPSIKRCDYELKYFQ